MIVHNCTMFNPNRNSNLNVIKRKNKDTHQVHESKNSPNFKALVDVKYLKRFDPEKSASAYELMNNFKLSYAIRELCDKYNVKATFMTEWYKDHPRIPHKSSCYYIASFTSILLACTKIKPDYDLATRDPSDFYRERYYYVGMFGDNSITESEEEMAYYLKKIPYSSILCNMTREPNMFIAEPLRRPYYER